MWKSQREKDREMFKEILQSVVKMNEKQLQVVAEQTKVVAEMMGFFQTPDFPKARVNDDMREIEIIKRRHEDVG